MNYRKTEEDLDCGIVLAGRVFGAKWKPCIIDGIHKGLKRPTQLHKAIPDAPKRVIDLHLSELTAAGVLHRIRETGYPRRTHYELTELGMSILPVIEAMNQWGVRHKEIIQQRLR